MTREVFVLEGIAALLEDGAVAELRRDPDGGAAEAGALHKARVTYVDSALEAAFLRIGGDEEAYLEADDAPGEGPLRARLRQGDELIVQVRRAASGRKAARVTARRELGGALCVLLVGSGGAGVSRKIEEAEERARLRGIAEGWLAARQGGSGGAGPGVQPAASEPMGVLMRTASRLAAREAVEAELDALLARWNAAVEAARRMPAPVRLTAAITALDGLKRDFPDAREVPPQPALLTAAQRDAAANSVRLPSGGRVVIERTEALTAIDVDSGAASGRGAGTSFEELALRVNLEAAREIARQLRLRDAGGIFIIDFLDMRKSQREELLRALKAAMAADAVPHEIGGFTRMGLVEVTRKRRV